MDSRTGSGHRVPHTDRPAAEAHRSESYRLLGSWLGGSALGSIRSLLGRVCSNQQARERAEAKQQQKDNGKERFFFHGSSGVKAGEVAFLIEQRKSGNLFFL